MLGADVPLQSKTERYRLSTLKPFDKNTLVVEATLFKVGGVIHQTFRSKARKRFNSIRIRVVRGEVAPVYTNS